MLKTCQVSLLYLLNGTCFIFAKTLRLSDSIWSIPEALIGLKNAPLTLRRQIRKQIMASEKRSVLDGDFSPLMQHDWSGPNKEVEWSDVTRRDVMDVAGGSHGDLVAVPHTSTTISHFLQVSYFSTSDFPINFSYRMTRGGLSFLSWEGPTYLIYMVSQKCGYTFWLNL